MGGYRRNSAPTAFVQYNGIHPPKTRLTLTVTQTGTVTPRFDFSAGIAKAFVNGVWVHTFVTGVEANIAVTLGDVIWYEFTQWNSVTLIDINNDRVQGDISSWVLPAALVYFSISSTGVTGDISGWVLPATLVDFSIHYTGVTGDISSWVLPAALVYFYIHYTGVSGDISSWVLPAALVYFSIYYTGVTGDISSWVLPATLVNFNINNTGVTGDISSWVLPASLVNFYIYSTGVTGDISSWVLPATLVTFYVHITGVSGDISGWVLPDSLANLYVYSTSVDYGTGGAFQGLTAALTGKVDFDSCNLTWGQVDNALVDCVTCGVNNLVIEIAGNNAAPSAVGLAAKATLETRGWTVTVTV